MSTNPDDLINAFKTEFEHIRAERAAAEAGNTTKIEEKPAAAAEATAEVAEVEAAATEE